MGSETYYLGYLDPLWANPKPQPDGIRFQGSELGAMARVFWVWCSHLQIPGLAVQCLGTGRYVEVSYDLVNTAISSSARVISNYTYG